MADVRADEFANNLGIDLDRFMETLRLSGVAIDDPSDLIELDAAYQAHVLLQQSSSPLPLTADHSNIPATPTETYSSANENSTQTYGSNNGNETETYGQDGQTGVYNDSQKSGSADFCTYHNLGPGDQIELQEGIYLIEKVLSSSRNTGEASVFQVKGPDQRSYALKLYYTFDNPKQEPNAEALERITAINDPDILKLHAFGTGAKKYQHQNCYEISDLALGGTLLDVPDLKKKYPSEFIRSNVIPEIHKGLLCLHKQGIYHCDIKPENIFYLDADQTDLVIGDYGSAKTPESEVSHTSMVKGTNIYIAPEQGRGLISEKNDYYSFGMTLIRLLYPEKMTKESQSQMLVRLVNRKKILNFKPELSEFDDLIGGLTLYDHDARWGAKEIDLWLAGEASSVIYGHDIPPIKLGHGQEIRSDLDLIKILDEEENWYELLFADQSSVDVLCRWVGDFQDLQGAKNFAALIRYYKNTENRDYLREAAIRYFNPQRPITIPPKNYDLWSADSIDEETGRVIAHLDDLWSQAKEEELRCYMLQLETTLHHLMLKGTPEQKKEAWDVYIKVLTTLTQEAKPVEEIEKNSWKVELSLKPDQIINLAYKFNPDRGFRCEGTKSITDLKELGRFFASNPQLYTQDIPQTERKKFLLYSGTTLADNLHISLSDFLFEALKDEIHTQVRLVDTKVYRATGQYSFKVTYGRSLQGYFKKENINYEQDSWDQSGQESITIPKASFGISISKDKLSRYLASETITRVIAIRGLNREEFDRAGKDTLIKQFKEAIGHDVSIRRNKLISITTLLIAITCAALYVHYPLRQKALKSLALAQQEFDEKNWDNVLKILDDNSDTINIFPNYRKKWDKFHTFAQNEVSMISLKKDRLVINRLFDEKDLDGIFTFMNSPHNNGDKLRGIISYKLLNNYTKKELLNNNKTRSYFKRSLNISNLSTKKKERLYYSILKKDGGKLTHDFFYENWRDGKGNDIFEIRLINTVFYPPDIIQFMFRYKAFKNNRTGFPQVLVNGYLVNNKQASKYIDLEKGKDSTIKIALKTTLDSFLSSSVKIRSGEQKSKYFTLHFQEKTLLPIQTKYHPTHTCSINGSLNARSGPSTTFPKIGSIKNGAKVQVINTNNNFYKITNSTNNIFWSFAGKTGKNFIKIGQNRKVSIKNNKNKSVRKPLQENTSITSSVAQKQHPPILTTETTKKKVSVSNHPFVQGQHWNGTYTCRQGKTHLDLTITKVRGDMVRAIFNFNHKNRAVGSFSLKGRFNDKANEVVLRPEKWIKRPNGYGMVGMTGKIFDNGHIFSGKINYSGCSDFNLSLINVSSNETIETTIPDISKAKLYGLIQSYYNTKGIWAGKFTIDHIEKVRIEGVSVDTARLHTRYKYSSVPGQSSQAGYDQRIFIIKKLSNSWHITEMKGHMSASFRHGLQNAF